MPPPTEKLKITVLKIPVADHSDLTEAKKVEIQRRLDGAALHELFSTAEAGMIVAEYETFVVK